MVALWLLLACSCVLVRANTTAPHAQPGEATLASLPPSTAPPTTIAEEMVYLATTTEFNNDTWIIVSFRTSYDRLAASSASIETFSNAVRAALFALPISIKSANISSIVLMDGGEFTIVYIEFTSALIAAEVTLAVLQDQLIVHFDEAAYDAIDGRKSEFPTHMPIIAAILPGVFVLAIIFIAFGMFHARRRRLVTDQRRMASLEGSVVTFNHPTMPLTPPLHYAVATNNLSSVQYASYHSCLPFSYSRRSILGTGADINAASHTGQTALHFACNIPDVSYTIIKELVYLGADPAIKGAWWRVAICNAQSVLS